MPHMSGGGIGYLYMPHFASCIKDPGPYQEFKGSTELPLQCDSSTLRSEDGFVTVPSGPGYGIMLDKSFIDKAQEVNI